MRSRLLVSIFAFTLTGVIASCTDEITALDRNFEDNATWQATLAAEVAGAPATATGRAWFVDRGSRIDYYIEYSGLSTNATNAHLHLTVGGGIYVQVQFVRQQSGVVVGSFDTSPGVTDVSPQPPGTPGQAGTQTVAEFRNLLDTGGLYVNVHSEQFGGGEIRGTVNRR
jgi:hypothetical protein